MNRGRAAALAILLLVPALPASASVAVPRLSGPVVDEAGVLDGAWQRRLSDLARAARAQHGGTGPQLQYLLVGTLDGEPIEDYSMRVAEAWKIGTKGRDDGVLVVVAVKDRKVRIEVGGGLEGGLTDAQSGRIIRSAIVPAFREGRYGEGLYAAGQQILGALGSLPEGMPAPRRQAQKEIPIPIVGVLLGFLFSLGAPALVLLFVAFVVIRALLGIGRGPRGPWGGGGFGGGFGGGGGFSGGGGGGWSGGGGGFSGGGASGSW